MKSEKALVILAVIITAGNVLAALINPGFGSLEAIMLGIVGAFLGGIYLEIREHNRSMSEGKD